MKLGLRTTIALVFLPIGLIACSSELNQQAANTSAANTARTASTASTAKSVSQLVKVSSGFIRGKDRPGNLREFLGIPYAAPPIGERRWQPPAPLASWTGERDVTQFGLPCYQPGSLSPFYDRSYTQMSEDCLTLNVWTRAQTTDEALPVMVWVHGGALVMGSGSDYDGAPLTDKGVVLVTINYRLGPFGFYAHPQLSAEGGGTSGNQGFQDQIAALNWVQDNIKQFGGDPDNVTIFGESAGSWSMSVLQASPKAQGLFHKVIGQSGARFIPLPDLDEARWGIPSAEGWGEELATIFAGTQSGAETPDLTALRSLSAESIISAYAANPNVLTNFDWLTIVDGNVLPDEVNTIFAQGKQADVPVLIGSNADEATTFDPAMVANAKVDHASLLKQFVGATLAGDNKAVFDLYPAETAVAQDSYIRFNTDASFTAPMRLWADYMGNVASPAYLYWWNWRPMIDGSDKYGAFHAAEIPYVFGNLNTFGIEAGAGDIAFADKMQTIWTNFAKSGNPSSNGIIDWPAYAQDQPTTAVLGAEIGLQEEGVRSEEVEVITAGYAARRL